MKGVRINNAFISEEELIKALPTFIGRPLTENFDVDKVVGVVIGAYKSADGIEMKIRFNDIRRCPFMVKGDIGDDKLVNLKFLSLGCLPTDKSNVVDK